MNSSQTILARVSTRVSRYRGPRAGLAPLELVLALPLLLAVMALIVNFAHAATWKIRSATNARLAMWRHRPMWSADSDPNPVNFWPQGASLSVGGGSRMSQIDQIWNHPSIAQGWIKGPIFVAGDGYLGVRNNRVNEMSEGMSIGNANVSLQYPFIPAMGQMQLRTQHGLLDSVWQYHTMGYSWNHSRRAKGWWEVEDSPEWTPEKRDFLMADATMVENPQRELMRPLDRDLELMAYYGHSNRRSDFYSRAPAFCIDDPQQVHNMLIAPRGMLDDIRGSVAYQMPGVCERMARSYLQMYQAELAVLEALDDPPADRIADLKKWIKQLTDYITKLTS